MYKTISASWEVGFSEYKIAVGSKNLKEAEIISDPTRIKEMKGMLRGFGGKGLTEEGKPIYRLITGDVYPLGIGFTMKPAANKGVISSEYKKEKTQKKKISNANLGLKKHQLNYLKEISTKNKGIISQKLKNAVNNNKIMDLENLLLQLKESLAEDKFSKEASRKHDFYFCRSH